jgi:hypothetical protein
LYEEDDDSECDESERAAMHYAEDDVIEVSGSDGYSVMISKRAIFRQPKTLLGEILKKDESATSINLQLDRVQLDLIASFFNSPEASADLVSFFENHCRKPWTMW